ncbi:unnamed protein product [Symbiodinium necroappetens]|uniref:Uncharacterized protein n=1 Tax=Symbiodinium necroappetens TaxID=1628268 RepID=A0A813AYI4_9DINO|nr:unnamed protein product [Symbiodinium necroappetens]
MRVAAAGASDLLLPGDPQGGHRHPTCAAHLVIFGSWRWVLNSRLRLWRNDPSSSRASSSFFPPRLADTHGA